MSERPASRRGVARLLPCVVACVAFLVFGSGSARAQPTLEQVVKATDDRLLAELRGRDEEAARLFEQAVAASRDDEVDRAVDLYERLRARLPGFSAAPRRECGLRGHKADHERAVELCRLALQNEDIPENRSALATALLLRTMGERTPAAVAREALAHARVGAKLAPDDPFAQRALCLSGAAFGDGEVLTQCKQALPRTAAAADAADMLAMIAYVCLSQGGLTNADRALGLAERAVELAPSRPEPALALYAAAAETGRTRELRAACAKLGAIGASALAAECAATLAIVEERWGDARTALAEAKAAGLDAERHARLASALSKYEPWTFTYLVPSAWVAAGWVALALLLFVVGLILSRLALRAAAAPPTPDAGGGASGMMSWVRGLYRAVLGLACVYYYVSIPILIGLVVAAVVGVVLAFLALGRLPIKLLVLVGVGGLVTVGALVGSLLRRPVHVEPGERLDLAKHPRLAALLAEVALRIGTRPVDAIYLTTGTDIAVFERGPVLRVARGRGERCLVLGVAAVRGLTLRDLRSILAHEYGHFSNRDTAGGHVALAVRRSLLAAAIGLARGGAASMFNPAWLFLNGFHRLFLRISHGASRLQEVLADRHAALAYGSSAFANGLRRVIEIDVRFDAGMNRTLERALEKGVAPHNLYRASGKAKVDEAAVERAVKEALERPPGPYDSHPPPVHRIELVKCLAAPAAPCPDDDEAAASLFDDGADLEIAMSALIVERVNEQWPDRRLVIARPKPKAKAPTAPPAGAAEPETPPDGGQAPPPRAGGGAPGAPADERGPAPEDPVPAETANADRGAGPKI